MIVTLPNINFEITDSCNLDCSFCYNYKEINNQTNSFPFKTLTKILQEAEVQQITFTGGEPMLSNDLFECVLHTKISNKKVVIITNGTAGNDKQFQNLIKAGVDHFQISFHSADPDIHNFLTQNEISWDKTVHRIKNLISQKIKVIPSIVLTKSNVSKLKETLGFLLDLGITTIMVNRYNIGRKSLGKLDTIVPNKNELNQAFEFANSFAVENNIVLTSNVCTPHCLVNPKDYPHLKFGKCSDNLTSKPITIDFRGNVRICNHSPKIIGNIFKQKLSDLVYSDYSCDWIYSTPEICIDCELLDDCNSGCRAASEQIGLTNLNVDPILEYCK